MNALRAPVLSLAVGIVVAPTSSSATPNGSRSSHFCIHTDGDQQKVLAAGAI
jgi:hypothetical protein